MTRKLYSLVAVAAASGALITGCGGGSTRRRHEDSAGEDDAGEDNPRQDDPGRTTPTASTTPSSTPSAEMKVAAKACVAESLAPPVDLRPRREN